MKKNKLSILLVCLLVLMLTACGSDSSNGSNDENNSSDQSKKVLRIVTDAAYAPMEYMDKEEVTGFGIEFIRAVAEEAGYEAQVEHVGWDPLFVEVESGRADLAVSSISITEERKLKYEFSVPYYLSTNKILVPENSTITSSADLKDKTVAVLGGSTGMIAAEKILGTNSKDIKKFESNVLAIQELKKKGADAVVADNAVVEEYAKNNPDDHFVVVEDASFDEEYYGVLFPKENTELRDEFNEAINTVFDNGTYAEIYEEWFGETPDIEKLKAQQTNS